MIRSIAGDLILPDRVLRGGWIRIDDGGKIAQIGTGSPPTGTPDLDFTGALIAPGFIDLHVHGGGGADFMTGTEQAARQAARTHARHGTTAMLATTLTATRPDKDRCIAAAMAAAHRGGADEARILGMHLEGPYICAARRGAQPLAPIRPPDLEELDHWIALSGGKIRQITLAPEVEGALEFVRGAAQRGVNISIGHTDATAEQTVAGIDAGARQATHLFNAMRGIHHREPGTAGAALAAGEVACELIVDGFHLAPMVVRIAVRAKGPDGCLLITDAIEAVDMPDGTYSLGGFPITVKEGTATLADGTLAGSLLTMDRAWRNVAEFAAVDVVAASRMASTTPARQIGFEKTKGSIEVGKDADLAVLDPKSTGVECTIVEGNLAYRR